MKSYLSPILLLVFFSGVLPELLSGNTPLILMIHPLVLLLLMTIGYGFPVLIIREIIVRYHIGIFWLVALGFIYWLYNEALIAKTILSPFFVPIDTFHSYGLVENIRIPWALTISFWHALFAVIYPIAFTHYLFPEHARVPWIKNTTLWWIGAIILLFGMFKYIAQPSGDVIQDVVHLFAIFGTSLLLWCLVWIRNKQIDFLQKNTLSKWQAVMIGVALFFALTVIPFLLPAIHISAWIYGGFFLVLFVLAYRFRDRISQWSWGDLVFVGLWGELMLVFFRVFWALVWGGRGEDIIVGWVFFVLMFLMILFLKFRKESV
jgi:hypothetical protein